MSVRYRKYVAVALGGTGIIGFISALRIYFHFKATRLVAIPSLGRVIEESDHGHRFYLTAAESESLEGLFFASVLLVMASG
jgi:hypothetical protein